MNFRRCLHRFARDRRGVQLDYMLSLFTFILSLGFTFLVLTQYLDMKHAEVGEVNERLASLSVLDELTGSPGWLGSRSDWESFASRVDMEEKVNDGSFTLGLRKNDRYYGTGIAIPGGSDTLLQSASQGSIDGAVTSLREQGVIIVSLGSPFSALLEINTSAVDPAITIPGADNVTTHVGTFYAGGDLDVKVTDMNVDGVILYDTAIIGSDYLQEGSVMNISGRTFDIHTIDQEKVLLVATIPGGYVTPLMDFHHFNLTSQALSAAGIRYNLYREMLSGGSSSLEYTLFCDAAGKFEGQATELSIQKIGALRDHISYDVAKSALGMKLDFHIGIRRISDGAMVLDYGLLVPGDTERVEREVSIDGVQCNLVVDIW